MKFASLGSGSKGNSTLIGTDEGYVLLDCGFSKRTLVKRLNELGVVASDIKAILITHEHSDHVKGAQSMAEEYNLPIYTSFGTARKMKWLQHPLWIGITDAQAVVIAGMEIRPCLVPHDAQEPLQYVFKHQGKKLGILSDLGFVTPYLFESFRGCHALQVEANHDLEMLKHGPYPPSLQKRVAGNYGHLNNQQCAQFIQRTYWSGLKNISIGHISEKNNSQSLVKNVISHVLPEDIEPYILNQSQVSDWQILTD